MASNRIEIYQHNTKTIGCVVVGGLDLSSFTPYLTIKQKASDTDIILSKIGVVTDPSTTVTFDLSATDTSISSGSYVYDIVLVDDPTIYTIVKDSFIVLDGVKF